MFGELSVDVVSIIEGIASHPSWEILEEAVAARPVLESIFDLVQSYLRELV